MTTTTTTLIVNTTKRTIEMSKTFAKAASIFGSEAYNDLQAARRDNPDFRIVTVTRKGTKNAFKGLTCEYMEKYIAAHDDENGSRMAEYKMLRGTSEAGKSAQAATVNYAEIKEWFFMTFPEIEKFHSDREELLKKIAERREAKQAARNAA